MSTLKVEKIQHPNSASVALTLDTSGYLALQAGSASTPAIQGPSDPNTGIFFPAADTIAFAEGGTEALRIDSSGRVGIGTSTAFGQGGLTIAPNYSQGSPSIYFNRATTANESIAAYFANADVNVGWLSYTNSLIKLNGVSSLQLATGSGGTAALTVDSSQRVGIGTTNPVGKLHIGGVSAVTDTAIYIPTGGIQGDNGGVFEIANVGNTTSELKLNTRGTLTFYRTTSGALGGGAEMARFDSSGRLLVGTSTGSERLRVAGQIQIGNGTSGGGGGGFVRTTQSTATGSSHTIAYADYGPNGGGDDFSGFMVITAQFTGYPGKTAVGTFAIGKNTAAGVNVTQLSNTKIGITTFTVGTSGNDITVTTDASCKVSCVFMGGQ